MSDPIGRKVVQRFEDAVADSAIAKEKGTPRAGHERRYTEAKKDLLYLLYLAAVRIVALLLIRYEPDPHEGSVRWFVRDGQLFVECNSSGEWRPSVTHAPTPEQAIPL